MLALSITSLRVLSRLNCPTAPPVSVPALDRCESDKSLPGQVGNFLPSLGAMFNSTQVFTNTAPPTDRQVCKFELNKYTEKF